MNRLIYFVLAFFLVSCDIGEVSIPPGKTVNGDLNMTAGEMRIGDEAVINGDIDVTAGEVRIGEGVTVKGRLEITAGEVKVGAGCEITAVEFTAGSFKADKGTHIAKKIEMTAGEIKLEGTEVDGGIYLGAGEITLGSGSIIHTGVFIGGIDHNQDEDSKIYVRKGAVVETIIKSDVPVKLHIEEGAEVPGDIIGPIEIIRSGS